MCKSFNVKVLKVAAMYNATVTSCRSCVKYDIHVIGIVKQTLVFSLADFVIWSTA